MHKTLRLILGDQLNNSHSWFSEINPDITYVLMEIKTETDYATHHIQKVVGFFVAMRQFANDLSSLGHNVIYIDFEHFDNKHNFIDNILLLVEKHQITQFEYQLPDEYRVDEIVKSLIKQLNIPSQSFDSEHFFTSRNEFGEIFMGKKTYLMESFYRKMRQKHNILMSGNEPLTGKWNYDEDNRKKLPNKHYITPPLTFQNNVNEIVSLIKRNNIKTIGNINASNFIWPINRTQSLDLLVFFVRECLPNFGTYQDAMTPHEWSLYHSRLSFSLNTKMISPREVIEKSVEAWQNENLKIEYNQLEGFVRQILGWREYMRGIYWHTMPTFAQLNFFENTRNLPSWYWTGNTKMNCLKHSIQQSLNYAYAHHIQRLMITGNFATLAGIHPDEVDKWYLGIYIDAIEWVEITNTRGMSQFADGGIIGSKPYTSSASYIHKMSHYCGTCYYNKNLKVEDKACPFNSLYWHFHHKNESKLKQNPRIGMVYNTWNKMEENTKVAILNKAEEYLNKIEEL